MYGDGVLEKLSSIATQSRELRGLVDAQIFAPFRAGIKRSPLGVWAHCAPFASQPHFFWAEMLREMCHGSGYSMVKTRAVDSFLERLRPEPGQHYKATTLAQFPRNGWIPLKKGQRSLLRDGTLYIFAPALFAEDDAPLVPAIPAASASALAGTAAFASAAAPTPPQVHHLRCGAWGLAVAVQRAPENYTNAFPPPPLESLLIGTSFEYAVDLDVAAPPPCAQRRRLEGGAEDVRDRATALTIVLARGAAKDGPVSKARWKPWRKLIPPQLLAALPIVRVISAGNAAQASAAVEDGTCCVELPWSALVAAAVIGGAGGGGGDGLELLWPPLFAAAIRDMSSSSSSSSSSPSSSPSLKDTKETRSSGNWLLPLSGSLKSSTLWEYRRKLREGLATAFTASSSSDLLYAGVQPSFFSRDSAKALRFLSI
jgi:hypothetical protein